MNKKIYLPLVVAMACAPMAVSAGTVSYEEYADKSPTMNDDKGIPDFAGKPGDVPPDFAGKPDDVPPDFAGKPDGVPPDFAGKPDDMPPDFAGKPDGVPPDFAGKPDLDEGGLDDTPAVPVPAAVWLFGSGLLGLIAVARRKMTAAG
ncbi:MAG: PEP-CTERM sorting domain-containing protein [Thiohalobacteraceae bacterium]